MTGIDNKNERVKILAKGEVSKSLVVKAHKFSRAAQRAIENAGGNVEVIQ
jgi:large subunit ribosomal protein L15